MKTLVFGSGGYVGSYLRNALNAQGTVARLDECGVMLDLLKPDVVVNCAGRTGRPNVDWCESNKIQTYEDNTLGAIKLGLECVRRDIHLVHISSGCIFFGRSPRKGWGGSDGFGDWYEDDQPNPRTVYTRSKYAADVALEDLGASIVRIRSPISAVPHPRNLLTKIRSYDSVVCAYPSVTWLDELPAVVRAVIDRRAIGVFHATNPGTVCISDLKRPDAQTIDEQTLRGMTVCERSSAHVTSRRLYDELGVYLTPMDVALPRILAEYEKKERAA